MEGKKKTKKEYNIKSRKNRRGRKGAGRERQCGATQKHSGEREIGQNRTNVIRKGNGILPGHFNGQQRPVSAENSNLDTILSFRENAPCPGFTTEYDREQRFAWNYSNRSSSFANTGNSGSKIILLFAPTMVDIRYKGTLSRANPFAGSFPGADPEFEKTVIWRKEIKKRGKGGERERESKVGYKR